MEAVVAAVPTAGLNCEVGGSRGFGRGSGCASTGFCASGLWWRTLEVTAEAASGAVAEVQPAGTAGEAAVEPARRFDGVPTAG